MRFVTVRAVCLACALMPAISIWIVATELIWFTNSPTIISLFFHVTAVLFVLAVLNRLVARWWPGRELSPGELLTIFVMLSVASIFSSHDLTQVLIPMLFYPGHAANPQNGLQELILDKVPAWSLVSGSPEAINSPALGNASLYRWDILVAWVRPLAFWGTFLAALMCALLMLNVLFRKQWTEREKLSFPIIQIPMWVATNTGGLLRSRLFWLAFGITATLDLLNGLSYYYPNLPEISLLNLMLFRDYFQEPPWNAMAGVKINVIPFIIGLVFFIPTDLLFSCWFFYVFFKLMLVVGAVSGLNGIPGYPFEKEQSSGGYMALGLLAIWMARSHLRTVWRTIWGRPGGYDETGEPLRYRTTALLLVLSVATLLAYGCVLGASWYVMVIFFTIFFLYSIAIAKMRAELGPPSHDLYAIGPEVVMHNAVGTRAFTEGDLTAFTMFYWFNRTYRSHFSGHSIEAFKIAQLRGVHARSMMIAIVIAAVVGAASGIWAILHMFHVHGYSSGHALGHYLSSETWQRMVNWTTIPQRPAIPSTMATSFGAAITLIFGFLRMHFTWWLLHPLGYVVANSWTMDNIWFCVFLGWLAKLIIVRYGGAVLYRQTIPFFIGLCMGEFIMMSFWTIFGTITATGGPSFMW